QAMDFFRPPNRLASLEPYQFPNDRFSKNKREQKSRDRSRHRSEGYVEKDVEALNLVTQKMEVIHHAVTPPVESRLANDSKTRSIRAPRLPLTRIRSPGEASRARSSAA